MRLLRALQKFDFPRNFPPIAYMSRALNPFGPLSRHTDPRSVMARTNAAAALCLVSTRLALRHGLILLEMPALPGDCVIRSLLAFLIAIRIHTCLRHDRLRCWALRPRMLRLLGMPGAHNSSETHSAAICISTYVHL